LWEAFLTEKADFINAFTGIVYSRHQNNVPVFTPYDHSSMVQLFVENGAKTVMQM